MSNRDTYVRVRLDADVSNRASKVFETMGLSIPDAVRLLMQWVAEEQRLPFPVEIPNEETSAAIEELEAGRGKRFGNVAALLADLESDD